MVKKVKKAKQKDLELRDLPIEIIQEIAIEMGYPDFISICETDQRFNDIVCNSDYVWRSLIKKDFPEQKLRNLQKDDINWRETYLQLHEEMVKITELIDEIEKKGMDKISGIYPLLFRSTKDQHTIKTIEKLNKNPVFKKFMTNLKDFHDSEKWRLALYFAFNTYYLVGPDYNDQLEALDLTKEVINVVSEELEEPENMVTKKQEKEIERTLNRCYKNKDIKIEEQCSLYDWFQIFMIFTRDQLLNNDFDLFLDVVQGGG